MRLYEINEQLERLLMLEDGNAVDQETGETYTPEALNELQMQFDEKVENCLLFVKNQQAEADAIKAEIVALQARAKACENRATRTKEYVAGILQGKKFSTARVALSYRKSQVCEVNVEADALPTMFQRVKVEADRTALKDFIKSGGKVDGVEIVTKQSVILR